MATRAKRWGTQSNSRAGERAPPRAVSCGGCFVRRGTAICSCGNRRCVRLGQQCVQVLLPGENAFERVTDVATRIDPELLASRDDRERVATSATPPAAPPQGRPPPGQRGPRRRDLRMPPEQVPGPRRTTPPTPGPAAG